MNLIGADMSALIEAAEKLLLETIRGVFTKTPENAPQDVQKEIAETLALLKELTVDDDPQAIQLRALKIYLAIVQHVRVGGKVNFLGSKSNKTLKIRLR